MNKNVNLQDFQDEFGKVTGRWHQSTDLLKDLSPFCFLNKVGSDRVLHKVTTHVLYDVFVF